MAGNATLHNSFSIGEKTKRRRSFCVTLSELQPAPLRAPRRSGHSKTAAQLRNPMCLEPLKTKTIASERKPCAWSLYLIKLARLAALSLSLFSRTMSRWPFRQCFHLVIGTSEDFRRPLPKPPELTPMIPAFETPFSVPRQIIYRVCSTIFRQIHLERRPRQNSRLSILHWRQRARAKKTRSNAPSKPSSARTAHGVLPLSGNSSTPPFANTAA